jgi:hypothetical protein
MHRYLETLFQTATVILDRTKWKVGHKQIKGMILNETVVTYLCSLSRHNLGETKGNYEQPYLEKAEKKKLHGLSPRANYTD